MQTAVFMDIQRRHVEQSRWTNIREYAAEVLRREEAKKPAKSRRSSSSQHKPTSRKNNNARQQARRPFATASAPVITNEKIQQATPVPNDIAYQQLEQIILQGNVINHAIPVNGIVQSVSAPPAVNDSSLYVTRETDGQGMDEDSFQKLLTAVQAGLQVISESNAESATHGPVNPALASYANDHRRGTINRDSLSAGSQISSNERQNYLSSCLSAMRTENDVSTEQKIAGLNMTPAKNKPNTNPKEPKLGTKCSNTSPKRGSLVMSDGVSKKAKPTRKVVTVKKKDFICPYDGCGKAFERRYNLKVHTRRHTGEMPYTCPKTSDGCFLYFRWRSSLRHHLKTVHNDVVPISQNNARATVTPAVIQTANADLGKNTSSSSSLSASTSSTPSSRSPTPGVSKSGRIKKIPTKKQGKARKNFPAVAVRQPTAQELAQLGVASVSKSSLPATTIHVPEKMVQAKSGVLVQKDMVEATHSNSRAVEMDLIDISSFLTIEDGMSSSPSSSSEEDDIFKGMDIDVPDHLTLPMLSDLPAPEDFFRGA